MEIRKARQEGSKQKKKKNADQLERVRVIEVSGQPPFWCGDNVSIQRPLKLVLTVKIWRNQISTDRSDFSSIERLDILRTDKIIQSMIFAFRILHTNFHCCLKTKQLYL